MNETIIARGDNKKGFFQNFSLKNIKIKFTLIVLFNVLDAILTVIATSNEFCYESNPIMRPFVNNIFAMLFIKTFIPVILLVLLFLSMKKATVKQLYISNYIINATLIYYFLIVIWNSMLIIKFSLSNFII